MSDGAGESERHHHRFTEMGALAWRLACAEQRDLEVLARATLDEEGRVDAPLEVIFIGTRSETRVPLDAVRRGCLILHSHPTQVPLEPSSADLDVAMQLRVYGAGCAIASPDASQFVLISPPPDPPPAKVRSWTRRLSRRFWLTLHSLETP